MVCNIGSWYLTILYVINTEENKKKIKNNGKKNICEILVTVTRRKDHRGNLDVYWRMILKWILHKLALRLWTGLNCLG
jgi:hypothetical protein